MAATATAAAEKQNVVQPAENGNSEAKTVAPATAAFNSAPLAEEKSVEAETVVFPNGDHRADEKVLDDEFLPEETAAFTTGSNGNGADDFNGNQFHSNLQSGDYRRNTDDAGGFHVTVIEAQNSGARNLLLLGSCFLVITITLAGVVLSLFNKELYAAGIENTELMNAMVVDDTPMEVEEEKPEKKAKDDAGGGGGGGRDEVDPVSKGRLAPQTKNPQIRPDVSIPQMNTELKYQAFTQGPERPVKVTEERYGDPNGQSYKLSNGTGTGGGQGSGVGSGQGSGRGTGQGSGIGSGIGAGVGDGRGDGRGSGDDNDPDREPPKPKPPTPVGPTEGVKIISKPRANYTDAARTNNIQGVVRVRVTFLANGTIGGISPVSNLGYGLTEQALAAARNIRFEPAKKGGVPQTVTKIVEYSFTLY